VVNAENLAALGQSLENAIDDADIRAIVVEGSGGVFCRGMDFRHLLASRGRSKGNIGRDFSEPYIRAVMRIRNSPKPVVAAIDGEVLAGGMGLALACDIVLATERSVFGLSEVLFGLIPAYVFPFLLERVPLKRARFLVLSSKTFAAPEAHRLGIVDDLAADDALEKLLTRYLKRLLYSSPAALALTKSYSDRIHAKPIAEAAEHAGVQLTQLLNDKNNIDAISAFLEGDKMPWMARYKRPRGEVS
jgi:enoyl-CoA hydratase/carnithine racemase